MSQIESVLVQQALALLKALSADAATRNIAWNRQLALISEIAERRAEHEHGMIEGTIKAQIAVLQKMLAKRFGPWPENCLARLASATSQELESWMDVAVDGPATLAAVFT